MRYSFLSLIFFLQAHAVDPISICDSKISLNQIDTIASSPNHILTDKNLHDAIGTHHLVLAGDTHFYTKTASMKDLIERFYRLKGAKACVAFEFPKVTSSADEYVEKYINDFKAAIDAIDPADTKKVAMISEAIKVYQEFQNYFKPLTQHAKFLGMKDVCVDDEKKDETEVSWFDRNASMAKNLTDLLRSGECTDVLMFVGKEHLASTKDSLQFFLSTFFSHYGFTTINLQMTEETIPSVARTWNKCVAPMILNALFFKSSQIQTNFKIMPGIEETTVQWQDFDYTLLIP